MTTSLAVLLAAGGGSRFTGPTHKLLAPLGSTTVAAAALRHVVEAAIGDVLVVTGAVDLTDTIADALANVSADDIELDVEEPNVDEPDVEGRDFDGRDVQGRGVEHTVSVVHHEGWAAGQATSLQVAIAEAQQRGADAVVVGLADQPFVTGEAWRRVAASDSPIAVATYDGRRRNPVRLHRSVWPLLPPDGDEGARTVMRLRPDLIEAIPCPGSPADIDTQEDLPTWPNRSSTNSR